MMEAHFKITSSMAKFSHEYYHHKLMMFKEIEFMIKSWYLAHLYLEISCFFDCFVHS
jgi:hypothetical protein